MHAIAPTFDGKRTIPSPEVTRIMLEMLQLTPDDKVLEIGTGSGYQTKELAKTGAEIHSIELEPWVDSTVITGECIFLHSGDGKYGLEKEAPFTALIATCGVEEIPEDWLHQTVSGGRAVIPVGDAKAQRLTLFRMVDSAFTPVRIGAYVRFQMMRCPTSH